MNEMVERTARALDSVTTGPDAGDLVISEIFSADLWRMMSERLARAAISAMRKPTPFMLEHGDLVVPSGFLWRHEGSEISGTQTIYHAMIDAALSEKP